jgi:hypothetical protein
VSWFSFIDALAGVNHFVVVEHGSGSSGATVLHGFDVGRDAILDCLCSKSE